MIKHINIFFCKQHKAIWALLFAVFTLGVSGIITQLVFIREFLGFFYGNELVIGVLFAVWMLLIAFGAWLGRYIKPVFNKNNWIIIGQLALSFLPLLSVFFIRYARIHFYKIGVSVDLNDIIIVSFVSLFVYCLLSGYLFTLMGSEYAAFKKKNNIAGAYLIETYGAIIGGLLFSFVFVFYLKTFEILRVLFLFNILAVFFLSTVYRIKIIAFFSVALFVMVLLSFGYNIDVATKKAFYKGQDIVEDIESPYGNITVTKMMEQVNFYENGLLKYSTGDIIAAEEKVHYVFAQHPHPEKVLLISGAISGSVSEILKYPDVNLDYVDYNPYSINVAKKYNLFPVENVNIIVKDPILFLKNTDKRYDIIIVDLPEPVNAQINRYFTNNFFKLLSERIDNNGVVSTSLSGTANYMSVQARSLHSIIYNTIKESFNYVNIIPGSRNFFLMSNNTLHYNFVDTILRRGIDNVYVNGFYVDDKLLERRSRQIHGQIKTTHIVNTDLRPIAYYSQIKSWLSQSNISLTLVYILIVLIIFLMVFRFNAITFCLFTGGFAGSALEVIIIISFQIVYGYLYGAIGVIISTFMIGLAVGVFIVNKEFIKHQLQSLILLQFFLVIFAFILPLFLWYIVENGIMHRAIQIAFMVLTLILGFLVGAEFAVGTKVFKKSPIVIASDLYSADMLGAALGAILAAAFLIPLLGIINVCLFVALINALSAFFLIVKRKQFAI